MKYAISKVITTEPNGIQVDITIQSQRMILHFSVADQNSFHLNLSRMEYINLVGILEQGMDLIKKGGKKDVNPR